MDEHQRQTATVGGDGTGRRWPRRVGWTSAAVALVLVAACGGGSRPADPAGSAAGTGTVRVTVDWPAAKRTIPAATQAIVVSLTVPNAGAFASQVLTQTQKTATWTAVPAGPAYLTAEARANADGSGAVLASGQTSLVVRTDVDNAPQLTLVAAGGLANSPWPKFRGNAQNTGRGTGSGAAGTLKWAFATNAAIESSPAIGSDGTVYVGSGYGTLYALNGSTGAKRWAFATGEYVRSSPAIGADGTVYVGSDDGKVHALNGSTGAKRWEFATGSFVHSSPAIGSDGTVYVGAGDGKVYALNGSTGAKQWEFATGSYVDSSPAIGSDGTVYVGSYDGKVYALTSTGAKRWAFVTGDWVYSSPAIGADGTVYVGSDDGKVHALNGSTGAKRWEFATGSAVASSPAIGSDGTIYVGSNDRKVYAIK